MSRHQSPKSPKLVETLSHELTRRTRCPQSASRSRPPCEAPCPLSARQATQRVLSTTRPAPAPADPQPWRPGALSRLATTPHSRKLWPPLLARGPAASTYSLVGSEGSTYAALTTSATAVSGTATANAVGTSVDPPAAAPAAPLRSASRRERISASRPKKMGRKVPTPPSWKERHQ